MLTITLAGREILGELRDPRQIQGLVVKPKGFQGWEGISSTRREALARANENGEHDTPVNLGSRVMTIDGWVFGETDLEVGNLSDSLTGLLGVGRTRVTVEHRGQTRWADGRVVLAVCDDSGADELLSEFQLQIVFADPRRYGDMAVHPGSGSATTIPVYQGGNFPAFPVIEIPDAPASYTIAAAGKVFFVSGATAGGLHTVYLRRGRVYRDGVEMPGVGHGDLWPVPPGPPMLFTLSAPGRIKITDTFV